MPDWIASEGWLPRLDATTERFALALTTADPGAPVPTCPGWTTADLGRHLGGIHQWARNAVVAGSPHVDREPAPADPGALPGWYRGHAHALLGTLREVGPDAPAWTLDGPGVAAFWQRRQTQETSMHLWDLLGASGQWAFDSALALDGIDEVVGQLFPRQVRLQRVAPLQEAIELCAVVSGADTTRFVLAGDGSRSPTASAAVAATVTGPAERLLLLLWKRIPLEDVGLHTSGRRDAVSAALESALTP